jgi:hypothetical protein
MFAKIVDGTVEKFPYSVPQDLKREYPHISFPKNISNINLTEYNIYSVTAGDIPEYNRDSEEVRDEIQLVNDVWTRVWTVSQLPLENASARIRDKRNRLLEESDWTQLPDVPIDTDEWAAYRRNLRNITSQAGFPYAITWPEAPVIPEPTNTESSTLSF